MYMADVTDLADLADLCCLLSLVVVVVLVVAGLHSDVPVPHPVPRAAGGHDGS
jgi:hypothetical protein